jgi:uncharacterized protein involved in exopolysaccharide biosynthesis
MQEPRDLDILDLIGAVWQRRRFVAAVTCAVAAIALGASLLLPRTYRSTAQLLVVRPMASDGNIGRAQEIPFKTFEHVIANWQNFVHAIEQLDLRTGSGEPMLPEQLDGSVQVRVLPDVDILEVDVWMTDPHLAQKVNRYLVDMGLKRYHSFTQTETEESAAQLETMAQRAEDEFKKYNVRLRDFLLGAELKQIEERLAVLAQAMKEVSQRLEASIALKQFEQAQAAIYSRAIADKAPQLELQGHYQMTPELASSLLGKPVAESRISFGQQIQNPAYVKAETELVSAQADLSGYDAEIQGLSTRMAELKADYTATETLFHERSAERRALESEFNARQTAYESIYKKRADAALNITTRRYALRVLSSASYSEKKASPRISLNVLAGTFLGLLVSVAWVLAEAYRRRRHA